MDPITSFSVFCNILTVVDVGVRTGRKLKELYDSPGGFTRESALLQRETENLRKTAAELAKCQSQLSPNPHQPLLIKVANECVNVSSKIQALLEECKVDPKSTRTAAVIKSWMRSERKKGELYRLQEELQSSAEGLKTAMAAASRCVEIRIQNARRFTSMNLICC
jgi:hypothetical protein